MQANLNADQKSIEQIVLYLRFDCSELLEHIAKFRKKEIYVLRGKPIINDPQDSLESEIDVLGVSHICPILTYAVNDILHDVINVMVEVSLLQLIDTDLIRKHLKKFKNLGDYSDLERLNGVNKLLKILMQEVPREQQVGIVLAYFYQKIHHGDLDIDVVVVAEQHRHQV